MQRTLKDVAELLQCRLVGDGKPAVSGIASIGAARAGDLVYAEDEKSFAAALTSQAVAIIAGEIAAASSYGKPVYGKPVLISPHPKLAFARAARLLFSVEKQSAGIHATAVIHPSSSVGPTVNVGACAIIGAEVAIGEKTEIGAGCVIGDHVRIGRDCALYPNVTVYAGTTIGNRVTVHGGAVLGSDGFGYVRDPVNGHYEKFPQIGRLEIEDDVEIGANTTIDRGALEVTRIGRGTKIDNLVHIGHNCQIGENVIIAAQTGLSGSITVEKNVVLGGQVGIGEHACIKEGVMLGGQGGVLPNKVLRGKGIAFWGTPARPVREYLKQLAVLGRRAKKE